MTSAGRKRSRESTSGANELSSSSVRSGHSTDTRRQVKRQRNEEPPGAITRSRRAAQRESSDSPDITKVVERPGIPPATRISAFVVPDKPSPPLRDDDKDGHYVYELGENLTSRYKILSKMGEGTFGRVLECWDRKHKEFVAIKIVRNVQKYRDAAMIELAVLNTLTRNDPDRRWHCVTLREWFDYRGHVCMVFDKLGLSLFDFLRKNSYRPFSLDLVREFGRQLLESVQYLHDIQLIHTDLKPENILLDSLEYEKHTPPTGSRTGRRIPASSAIRVIDFGSATFEDQYHSSIVSTRHYRAPEVILGTGWSYPCDIWSIGCILSELVTGEALFQTHENLEHLAMMEAVLGPIPEHLAEQANRQSEKYFNHRHRLNWPEGASGRKSIKAVQKMNSLKAHILALGDASVAPHVDILVDLLLKMLRYDPSERITAKQALQHEFFRQLADPLAAPNGKLAK